jgi:hypothetical protein
MKKFALLLIVLLTASLFAQTKPSPNVPKWMRWQITPTASVQYDPTVWKLGTIESPDHDNAPVLFLMNKDKLPRADVALSASVIESDDMFAADIIAQRIAKTEDEKGVTEITLKEYQAGEEYGVLFAYTTTNTSNNDYVIARWSFAGDKLDTKSRQVIEFEGVIPILKDNDDILEKMDAVIKTYQIKELVPDGAVPLPKK